MLVVTMRCQVCQYLESIPPTIHGQYGSRIDFCSDCGRMRGWHYPDEAAIEADPFNPEWDNPKYCEDFIKTEEL